MGTRKFRPFRPLAAVLSLLVVALFFGGMPATAPAKDAEPAATSTLEDDVTQGALRVKAEDGTYVECPLKHTDVRADVSGFIARVRVKQTFYNPYNEKIEAVYVFPLPHTAAVDEMTMVIGERRIVGEIKRRAEARAIYEQALAQGMTTALLEQERPNIFTQSVGNIKPQQEINIEIAYVDVLKYDMGTYEFHFPMVVGPRYIPGGPISAKPEVPDELKGKVGESEQPGVAGGADPKGTGWSADTTRVDDASRITPPVLKPGFRNGHDISLALRLDAGVPIQDLKVVNHKAEVEREGTTGAAIALSPDDTIPNKDFVVKYGVVGEKPEMAVLSHCAKEGDGYFMLMIQPKLDEELAKAPPRDICFLVDVSGSMRGEPTAKVKEAMRQFFKLMKPEDRLQVIAFAGSAESVFKGYVPANEEYVGAALAAVESFHGSGGTEMLKGIRMVLADPPDDPKRVRIVVMLTDGFIGNEAEIIAEVGKRAGDQIRFWTIGIGSSPNRMLIDGVAKTGGGMSAVLELGTDPKELVEQIVERIHRAQFANIAIDWKGLPVFETYPARVPELWAGRPVILYGRYEDGGTAKIELNGTIEGEPHTYSLDVSLPKREADHDVLSKVWARQKIEDLSAQMFYGNVPEVVEEITQIALAYSLMSQYTSFVAVDESERGSFIDPPRPPRRMVVPVPMPEGVSYEGVFGPTAGEEYEKDGTSVLYVTDAWSARLQGNTPMEMKGIPQSAAKMRSYTVVNRTPAAGPGVASGFRGDYSGREVRLERAMRPVGSASVENARLFSANDGSSDLDGVSLDGRGAIVYGAFAEQSAKRHEEAAEALKAADELRTNGDLEAAMARYQQAYLLESAFLTVSPWQDDGTSAKAAQALEDLLDEIAEARAKTLPALDTRLDLVIRDKSVAEAVAAIAEAAGFKATIIDGSIEDAAALLNVKEPRITYLDLRRAKAWQALNWVLTPAHLSWQLGDDGGIVVGTSRRLSGAVAWVYPVGNLIIPMVEELGATPEEIAKAVEAGKADELAKAATEGFLKGVRLVLAQQDDGGLKPNSAVLIGPGGLLVYADREAQARVGALLTALVDAKADVTKAMGRELTAAQTIELKALQAATSKRWAARAEAREKRLAWNEKMQTLTALDTFGWQLLAGACRGEVDDEALTELGIAWNSTALGEILESENAWLPMRVAWILSEASRAVPEDKALRDLAAKALGNALKHADAYADALEKEPNELARYMPALYARLAFVNVKGLDVSVPNDLTTKLTKLLIEGHKDGPLAPMGRLTHMLLLPAPSGLPPWPSDAPVKAIKDMGDAGDDVVLLAAFAAHRIGGDAWRTFRENMQDVLGSRPLDGNVVVIVNRLAETQLAAHSR